MRPTVDTSEARRLLAIRALGTFGARSEPPLEALCRTAKALFSTEMAAVTLIGEDELWFAAECGLNLSRADRQGAFCSYAIASDEIMVVEDADEDARFAEGALASKGLGLRFYAGAPLTLTPGIRVGALCLLHRAPRALSSDDRARLTDLASVAVSILASLAVARRSRADHDRCPTSTSSG